MDTKELSKVQKDRNIKLEKLRSEGFDYPNDFEKKYAAPYGSIYGKVSHGLLGTIMRPSNTVSYTHLTLPTKRIV